MSDQQSKSNVVSSTKSSSNSGIGVSSCMGGTFIPLKGDTSSGNQWSFCYNKSSQKVSLDVTINTPTMLVDINNQRLKAEFNHEDIQQLVIWLFQVKSTMQQQLEQSPGGSDSDSSSDSSSSASDDSKDSSDSSAGKS